MKRMLAYKVLSNIVCMKFATHPKIQNMENNDRTKNSHESGVLFHRHDDIPILNAQCVLW